jgi:hypothetical protein
MGKNYICWCAPIIPETEGSLKYEELGLGQQGQKERPYLQNNQKKNR